MICKQRKKNNMWIGYEFGPHLDWNVMKLDLEAQIDKRKVQKRNLKLEPVEMLNFG
jgi:hypothetical protein